MALLGRSFSSRGRMSCANAVRAGASRWNRGPDRVRLDILLVVVLAVSGTALAQNPKHRPARTAAPPASAPT